MWVWRLKQSLFGPTKAIELDSAIFELAGRTISEKPDYPLGKPDFTNTNGLQVWIIHKEELLALRRSLLQAPGNNLISQPRVSTAHGVQATLSVGYTVPVAGTQGWSGVVMDFSPRVRADCIDLTTVTAITEAVTNDVTTNVSGLTQSTNFVSIRTNLALAARFQIPKGSGVFLLNKDQDGTNGKPIGILISATQPQPKK